MVKPFEIPYNMQLKTKGATCGICGKELFDEKNMEEHYKEEHLNKGAK